MLSRKGPEYRSFFLTVLIRVDVLSDSMSNLIILADAALGSRPSSGGMVQ
jgi:hypothetical protein